MKQKVTASLLFIALSACQQNGGNAAGNAAGNGSATNTANASTAAAPAASNPAMQTGPVALATDSSLPAPCQTVVRETQTCIDNLAGSQAGFREEWLRSMLASSRSTWASAADDSYRGPVCEQDLRTLRQRVSGWDCGAH